MNKQEWDAFLENTVMASLCKDDWTTLVKGLEDGDGHVAYLQDELLEAHNHLTKFGIGKTHWSLPGRLALLTDEPKGNVFESQIVKLLAVLADLTRCCEDLLAQVAKEGLPPTERKELKHAKMLLEDAETWHPGFGNLTISYAADAEEVRRQVRESLGLEDGA
jgi:hypothetical protein